MVPDVYLTRPGTPTLGAGASALAGIEALLHDLVMAPSGEIRRKALRTLVRQVETVDTDFSAPVFVRADVGAICSQGSQRISTRLEQISGSWPSYDIGMVVSMPVGNCTWRRPDVFGHYDDLVNGYLHWGFATPPNAQASMLSMSLVAAFNDLDTFVYALADVVHAVITQSGKPKKTLLANCVDKRRKALMRFVTGFFGSHKVDARNNP